MPKDDGAMAGKYQSPLADPELKGWHEEMLEANRARAEDHLRRSHMYQTERLSISKTAITRFLMRIR